MAAKAKFWLLFLCLTFSTSALAANVSVNCNGATPGTFPSITAALSSLAPAGPNVITVRGICQENVVVGYYQNLTIQSAPGAAAVIENAANPADIVFQSVGCRGLVLVNLVIEGGTVGLLVNQASEVVIHNVTVKNNGADGATVQIGSTLGVESSQFINNGGNGLTAAAMSNVTLSTAPGETILFSGNAGAGISVDAAYLQVNFGAIRVVHNTGPAMLADNGQLLIFGGSTAGEGNVFQGNGGGIDLFDTSSGRFYGTNIIENNGEIGLLMLNGSSANFFGGPSGASTISGHSGTGVLLIDSSSLTFDGPHVIRGNGSATDTLRSGIAVGHGNLELFNGATVQGNTGPGVTADESSTVNVSWNALIQGNTEDGVRLAIQSNANFTQPISIVGNGGASIACDTTSVAYGDFTGIKNVDCSQVAASRLSAAGIKYRPIQH
ncbi:MAG TPA: right-handed parallel beta-helix repeat-containing protein [Candidatus Solibacter sp.]|nr:right-handed parallel beta-helix repeat-containing protein [Candidatus Solibacter sp.]